MPHVANRFFSSLTLIILDTELYRAHNGKESCKIDQSEPGEQDVIDVWLSNVIFSWKLLPVDIGHVIKQNMAFLR